MNSGTVLVRLRAVAMERDDNSEGWVPIGAGGLSNVCIVKRPVQGLQISACKPDPLDATSKSSLPGAPAGSCPERLNNTTNVNNGRYEFIIYANRLIDDELVFRCVVCKDFEYNKVMPTFHNWYNGGKRVGLIFQTAADGRVFDRGIMGALVELSAGMDLLPPSVGDCDNDVFMAIELPYKIDNNKKKSEINSRHVSPTSTDSSSLRGTPPVSESEVKSYRQKPINTPNEQNSLHQPASLIKQQQHHHKTSKISDSVKTRTTGYLPPSPVTPPPRTLSSGPPNPLDSPVFYKKKILDHELEFSSSKGEKPQRLTCKHCRKRYTQEENIRGSCEYAPDNVRSKIDKVTCLPCARTVIYHCMADSEGNFAQPCECDTCDCGCTKRWFGLTLLSILLPCMWCYPLLKVCHLCGVSCGVCGGRHEPLNSPSTATS